MGYGTILGKSESSCIRSIVLINNVLVSTYLLWLHCTLTTGIEPVSNVNFNQPTNFIHKVRYPTLPMPMITLALYCRCWQLCYRPRSPNLYIVTANNEALDHNISLLSPLYNCPTDYSFYYQYMGKPIKTDNPTVASFT